MKTETPHWEKPLAIAGLISYRYPGMFSWIMIGAKDNQDALREANRSLSYKTATLLKLEVWNGTQYTPAITPATNQTVEI